MSQQQAALEALRGRVGEEIYVSPWMDVPQERIDAFAEATGDHQWIHIDPERAARESPYGATIAHGYLTLSLYPALRNIVDNDRPPFPGVKQVINYGIDRLRFPNAVRAGARVRARCALVSAEEVKGGIQVTERFTAEIEGEERPACVADLVMRYYF